MAGRDVLEGRSGGTLLPDEFLAPLSLRHRSSDRIGKMMPGHSERVDQSVFLDIRVIKLLMQNRDAWMDALACDLHMLIFSLTSNKQ